MALKEFIEKFEKLKGENEFDYELYSLADDLHGEVHLGNIHSDIYNCFLLTMRGKLEVRRFSMGIAVTANEPPNTKALTHLEFMTQHTRGHYNIYHDPDLKRTEYSFTIEDKNRSVGMSIDVFVEDNKDEAKAYEMPY